MKYTYTMQFWKVPYDPCKACGRDRKGLKIGNKVFGYYCDNPACGKVHKISATLNLLKIMEAA